MASPNTLALRARMDALRPTAIRIDTPQHAAARRAAPGIEFKRLSLAANLRRHRRILAANQGRAIPVGGPGRRRAKQHRNEGLCLGPVGGNRCGEPATHGDDYCAAHLTVERLRERGALEVADIIDAQSSRQAENAA